MSIGPLFSELAHSTETSLFDKIGLVLTYVLMIVATLVALLGSLRLWKDRDRDKSDQDE